MPRELTSSIQRDIMNARPSELDALNGAVVRLGKEAEVETPMNAFIYYSLLPGKMRARGQIQFRREKNEGMEVKHAAPHQPTSQAEV